jgi:predicted nucleic acid-binding protein
MSVRVFADTSALLAMVVFPHDQAGNPSLAGEVLSLYVEGKFELILAQAVVDELDEVLYARFPDHWLEAATLLRPHAEQFVRRPTPAEITAVLPFSADPFDAPIFASALIAQPDIVLSNDFRAFHTPQAKLLWQERGITVKSLYGLLCVFGLRERKGD